MNVSLRLFFVVLLSMHQRKGLSVVNHWTRSYRSKTCSNIALGKIYVFMSFKVTVTGDWVNWLNAVQINYRVCRRRNFFGWHPCIWRPICQNETSSPGIVWTLGGQRLTGSSANTLQGPVSRDWDGLLVVGMDRALFEHEHQTVFKTIFLFCFFKPLMTIQVSLSNPAKILKKCL